MLLILVIREGGACIKVFLLCTADEPAKPNKATKEVQYNTTTKEEQQIKRATP